MKRLFLLAPLLLQACCIAPNTLRIQGEHLSHASQHVDGTGGHVGAELVGIEAHWQFGHWFANLNESYNLSSADGHACLGGICGEREIFFGSAGYEFKLK